MKQDKEIKPLIIDQEESLRLAKEALQADYEALVKMVKERAAGDHRHLNAKDKIETDWGLLSLTASYQIAARGDSREMVQAVRQAMAGTFFIVWHCGASPAAKKYFDNQDHGLGGSTPRAPTVAWLTRAFKWLDGKEMKNPALTGLAAARSYKLVCAKANDPLKITEKHLARVFGKELERRKNNGKVVSIGR